MVDKLIGLRHTMTSFLLYSKGTQFMVGLEHKRCERVLVSVMMLFAVIPSRSSKNRQQNIVFKYVTTT